MVEKLNYYQGIAREMIDANKELRNMQLKYEAVSWLNYTLPAPLNELEWVVPFRSTVPYDALRGGTKALTNLDIRPMIHPITVAHIADGKLSSEEVANAWETALNWQFNRATRRRANFNSSVIWNALVYDELVGQVIHIPTQIKALKALGASSNRQTAALRYGDFAIRLVDPKSVYVRYSDYMPEAVLNVVVKTAQDIVDFWGRDAAKEIYKRIKADPKHAQEKYSLIDYEDLDARVVWATEGDTLDVVKAGSGNEILRAENEYPFLKWSAVVGGTSTETRPEHQRKPLLYPLVMAEQWLFANILGTLGLSQGIAEANAPIHELHGPGAENVQIDHSEPGGAIVTPQAVNYIRQARQNIDPALRELLGKYESDMNRSTLPSILVTAEAQPGESFSGYSLRINTAIGALMPFKALAERFYEGIFKLMLLHSHYSGTDIDGYAKNDKKYRIKSSDIDPNIIEMKVELSPDVPVDRIQKITAAVQMATQLNYSPIKILEYLGETDPQGSLKDWISWKFIETKVQARLQSMMTVESGQLEQMAQQMAQGMMQEQAKAQQQQGQEQGQPQPGQGMNTAQGGPPPIEAMGAGATFEGSTGRTRR